MQVNQQIQRVLKGHKMNGRKGRIVSIQLNGRETQHFVLWDDEAKGVVNPFTGKREPAKPMPFLKGEIKPI